MKTTCDATFINSYYQVRIHTGFHRFTEIGQIFINDSKKEIYFPGEHAPDSPLRSRTLRLRRSLFRKSVTISSRSPPDYVVSNKHVMTNLKVDKVIKFKQVLLLKETIC